MSVEWKRASKWVDPNPKCIFCDIPATQTVIHRENDSIIRGWRCPRCGFTIIHPKDIQRALQVMSQTAEVWRA
jgi:DNA-directed RNA polymerase subunit RPC12/RpoP